MDALTEIRAARREDTPAMADILNRIIAIGGTTAHRKAFDTQAIVSTFIEPKLVISCHVAIRGDRLIGFQALEWCDPDWPGDDRLPPDWAVIATYVDPDIQGTGAGRALFGETARAAKEAGVRFIDATVRKENTRGLAYYSKLGFTDYRSSAESVSKRFAPA